MVSHTPAIQVTLRSTDGLDDFEERKIVLTPGEPVPIGRSSKNAHKKLLPAVDNGFIDSPVISRDHAILSADSGANVMVIDKGSMHGTLVNDRRLDSHQQQALRNGDQIQFGVNVIRDQDSFIAKRFIFESSMLEPSRSSFRVPDTPEDEDMEESQVVSAKNVQEVTVPRSPRAPIYGTQSNPVDLDDFEDPEITFVGDSAEGLPPIADLIASDEDGSDIDDLGVDIDGITESDVSRESHHSMSFHDDDDDDDGSSSSSGDASMDESDVVSSIAEDSEPEQPDEDAEDDLDEMRRLKMEAMLNHEQITHAAGFTPPPEAPAAAQLLSMVNPNSSFVHSTPPAPFFQKVLQSQPLTPDLNLYNAFEVDSWENTNWTPPAPPRPSAPPKPSVWGPPGSEFAGPSMVRHGSMHNPWYEEAPSICNPYATHKLHNSTLPPYLAVSNDLTSVEEQNLSKAPPRNPDPEPMKDLVEPEDSSRSNQATTKSSVPTPPATVNDTSSPPQPARRTKVSIQEITETAPEPESPPTPKSMKSLKRKAEVLDDDMAELLMGSSSTDEVQTAPVVVVQTEAERPRKKRPLSTALSYMATGVMGGAVAVGALMFIPEGFFA